MSNSADVKFNGQYFAQQLYTGNVDSEELNEVIAKIGDKSITATDFGMTPAQFNAFKNFLNDVASSTAIASPRVTLGPESAATLMSLCDKLCETADLNSVIACVTCILLRLANIAAGLKSEKSAAALEELRASSDLAQKAYDSEIEAAEKTKEASETQATVSMVVGCIQVVMAVSMACYGVFGKRGADQNDPAQAQYQGIMKSLSMASSATGETGNSLATLLSSEDNFLASIRIAEAKLQKSTEQTASEAAQRGRTDCEAAQNFILTIMRVFEALTNTVLQVVMTTSANIQR
jgi:hypothetical protein